MFNLPVVKWSAFLPDPPIMAMNNQPWDLSTNLPLIAPFPNYLHDYGYDSLISRAIINQMGNMMHLILQCVIYPKSRYITPEARLARHQIREDVMVGDGVMGIRDRK